MYTAVLYLFKNSIQPQSTSNSLLKWCDSGGRKLSMTKAFGAALFRAAIFLSGGEKGEREIRGKVARAKRAAAGISRAAGPRSPLQLVISFSHALSRAIDIYAIAHVRFPSAATHYSRMCPLAFVTFSYIEFWCIGRNCVSCRRRSVSV